MTMRALKAFPYNGRIYRPGDVFEPASDARHALRALQLAVDIDDKPPKKKPAKKHRYSTMVMRAEDADE
jgi:hypothetical protein